MYLDASNTGLNKLLPHLTGLLSGLPCIGLRAWALFCNGCTCEASARATMAGRVSWQASDLLHKPSEWLPATKLVLLTASVS